MKIIAYIAVSLDGFIADKNGSVDWLNEIPNPERSDYGFAEFMQGVDAIIMGSNTFRVVRTFGVWPYKKPVFVASNSITTIPEGYENRISLVNGEIDEIFVGIQKLGFERLYVDGGKLIQCCLQAEMMDEMIITHIPIVLGGGIALFPELEKSIYFEHRKTEVVGVGLVKSHYIVRNTANKQVQQMS